MRQAIDDDNDHPKNDCSACKVSPDAAMAPNATTSRK
jgi:hypothetical protein